MQSIQQRIITAVLAVVTCFGCTDKDRETTRRTNDGAETFKFKPPENSGALARSPATVSPATVPGKPGPVLPKDSDGSDTFHFKQDPRTIPKAPAKAGR